MKIVQCSKCGNMMHATSRCYKCGSTAFQNIDSQYQIHPNAQEAFCRLDTLISDKKYDGASLIAKKALEWMPQCSEVYWAQLLAFHKCSSDTELICKGFSIKEDPNFINAMKYASSRERQVYINIQVCVEAIQKMLLDELRLCVLNRKKELHMDQLLQEVKTERSIRSQKLFGLWEELNAIEQKLMEIEKDFFLIVREYEDSIENAKNSAWRIKNEIYKLEECTDKQLHQFRIRLNAVLKQAEQAKDTRQRIKREHPWSKEFSQWVAKKDQKLRSIEEELKSLKNYEDSIKAKIAAFELINSDYTKIASEIEGGSFVGAKKFFGDTEFARIIRQAEVIR